MDIIVLPTLYRIVGELLVHLYFHWLNSFRSIPLSMYAKQTLKCKKHRRWLCNMVFLLWWNHLSQAQSISRIHFGKLQPISRTYCSPWWTWILCFGQKVCSHQVHGELSTAWLLTWGKSWIVDHSRKSSTVMSMTSHLEPPVSQLVIFVMIIIIH